MDTNSFSAMIFDSPHPHLMAVLLLLLAAIYVFKFVCVKDVCTGDRRKPIYILRAFLWGLFAITWAAFPYLDVVIGRSVLRLMLAIVVVVEIAYNLLYIKDAFKEARQWIRTWTPQ